MTGERAEQLQFLRFVGFLLVCAHHLRMFNVGWFPGEHGACSAVVFFFVLGGFLSGFFSFDKDIRVTFRLEKEYLLKKLRRLYPLYFATNIFAVLYSEIPSAVVHHDYQQIIPEIKQLAKCLLLIQSWFPEGYFSFNAVGWFLSTVFFLYVFNLPLRSVFSRIKKLRRSGAIFGAVAAGAGLAVCLYCYATRKTDILYTQYVLPLSRLGEYICGMALGYLVYPLTRRIRPTDRKVFWIFTVIEAAALIFWLYNMYTPCRKWEMKIVHWLLPGCILIVAFSFGNGLLSKVFRNKWLVYLGDISYECFIIHVVLIRMVVYTMVVTVMAQPNSEGKIFFICFIILMTIMIAAMISKTKAPLHMEKFKHS